MPDSYDVHFARADDGVHIAYRDFGVGRYDILFVPGQITHLDLSWSDPWGLRWLQGIGRLGRAIVIDRRGVGLSDRLSPGDLPAAEVLAEDLGVVLDAAGAKRPVLFGFAEGGQIASIYAALHPDRVAGLILYATWTHTREKDLADWEEYIAWAPPRWGSHEVALDSAREVAPSRANDPSFIDWVARIQRAAVSPGAVATLFEYDLALDVRDALSTIEVPTLVLYRERDGAFRTADLAEPAELIPGAQLVVLPGEDHWITADPQEPMFEAIGAFLEGLGGVRHEPVRRLATVLFTDIVGSTERSAELGDHAWRDTLERHHSIVRDSLERHGGREISTAGDGFVASFEGPAAACRSALDMMTGLRPVDLEIRAGVHTGEVELIDGEIGGIGVAIGARIGALAGASELLVSSTVRDLSAGSGLTFGDAGEHDLKGVPDRWQLYRVTD